MILDLVVALDVFIGPFLREESNAHDCLKQGNFNVSDALPCELLLCAVVSFINCFVRNCRVLAFDLLAQLMKLERAKPDRQS